MIVRVALAVAIASLSASPAALAADKKAQDPLRDPDRLVSIGNNARANGDGALALNFYDRAIALDATHLPALRAAAEVALALAAPDAKTRAERWLAREPKSALAILATARAEVQQNQPEAALALLRRAEAAGGPPAAIAVQRGIANDLLGRPRDAQVEYAKAMSAAPGDLAVLQNMALSLAIAGDDAAALQLLQPYDRSMKGTPAFERTLVLVHALSGRVDVATRIAEASLPPEAGASIRALLGRLSQLRSPMLKAAAVHLGTLPAEAASVALQAPPAVTAPPSSAREVAAAPVVEAPPVAEVAKPAAPMLTASPPAKPTAKPAPPAAMPKPLARLSPAALKASQLWVQIGSTPDPRLLPAEHAALKKKAAGIIDAYHAYVQIAGTAHRLLIGPFAQPADASRVATRLKARRIGALVARTPAGVPIRPL
jgi:Flp pilus assembly protein TadD